MTSQVAALVNVQGLEPNALTLVPKPLHLFKNTQSWVPSHNSEPAESEPDMLMIPSVPLSLETPSLSPNRECTRRHSHAGAHWQIKMATTFFYSFYFIK